MAQDNCAPYELFFELPSVGSVTLTGKSSRHGPPALSHPSPPSVGPVTLVGKNRDRLIEDAKCLLRKDSRLDMRRARLRKIELSTRSSAGHSGRPRVETRNSVRRIPVELQVTEGEVAQLFGGAGNGRRRWRRGSDGAFLGMSWCADWDEACDRQRRQAASAARNAAIRAGRRERVASCSLCEMDIIVAFLELALVFPWDCGFVGPPIHGHPLRSGFVGM